MPDSNDAAGVPRIILCGGGYAAAYRHSLGLPGAAGTGFIGIVGRGGPRSRALAASMAVPGYCSVTPLLPRADLAIVAVGGHGGDHLAMECLRHRVPILREHPVTTEFVAQATSAGDRFDTPWLVNPHFAFLPAPQALLERCGDLARSAAPVSIAVVTNARMAFSAIDLLLRLARVCGLDLPVKPVVVRSRESVRGTWRCSRCNVTLEMRPNFAVRDNVHDVMQGHRFNVSFPQRQLQLCCAAGPLVELDTGMSWSLWPPREARLPRDAFAHSRERANLAAIDAMTKRPPTHADLRREARHAQRTALAWEHMMGMRG